MISRRCTALGGALAVLAASWSGCGGESGDGSRDGGVAAVRQFADPAPRKQPVPAGEEITRAVEAARAAIAVKDWGEAGRAVERGLDAAGAGGKDGKDDGLGRAFLLLERGNAEAGSGRVKEAERDLADAMAVFHVHQSAEGRFRTFLALAGLEIQRGDYIAAGAHLTEAETLLGDLASPAMKGVFKMHRGRLAAGQEKHDQALAAFQEASQAFEAAHDKRSLAEALLLLAAEEDAEGRVTSCRAALDRAQQVFKGLRDSNGEARALHRLAGIAEREGKHDTARRLLKRVLENYEQLGLDSAAASVRRHIDALPQPAEP